MNLLKNVIRRADNVIDLLKRKERNRHVLDQMKNEDSSEELAKQHQEDKKHFRMTTPELSYPSPSDPTRRYKVHVAYPSFDEAGSPFFDQNSIEETLSMTSKELENHKWQEEQGYLKILSIKPIIPKR